MKQVSVPDSESGAGRLRVRYRAERVESSSHHYRITQRPRLNYSQLPDNYTQHTRKRASAPYWKWLQLHILSLTSSVGQCYFMFVWVSMSVVLAWLRPHYHYYYGRYKKARPHGVVIHIFSCFLWCHRIFPQTSFERVSWKTFVKPGTVLVFYSEHTPWSLQAPHTVGDPFQAHSNKSYNIWTWSFTEKMHTFHVTISESLTRKTGQCKYSWYKWATPSAIKYLSASQKNSSIQV